MRPIAKTFEIVAFDPSGFVEAWLAFGSEAFAALAAQVMAEAEDQLERLASAVRAPHAMKLAALWRKVAERHLEEAVGADERTTQLRIAAARRAFERGRNDLAEAVRTDRATSIEIAALAQHAARCAEAALGLGRGDIAAAYADEALGCAAIIGPTAALEPATAQAMRIANRHRLNRRAA